MPSIKSKRAKSSIASRVFNSAMNKHSKIKFKYNPRHFHAVAKRTRGYKDKETKFIIIYAFEDGSMLKVTNNDAEVI